MKEENSDLILNSLNKAIKGLKIVNVRGQDKLISKMIKYLGETGKTVLLEMYNRTRLEESTPSHYKMGLIQPIHKRVNTKDCCNIRGITAK